MPTPRYTFLRVVAYVLELLAVTVFVVSFFPGIAAMPWFQTVPTPHGGVGSAGGMGAWFFTLVALPNAIGLYVAGQLILLLVETRVEVYRLARRLDEPHPPERS